MALRNLHRSGKSSARRLRLLRPVTGLAAGSPYITERRHIEYGKSVRNEFWQFIVDQVSSGATTRKTRTLKCLPTWTRHSTHLTAEYLPTLKYVLWNLNSLAICSECASNRQKIESPRTE